MGLTRGARVGLVGIGALAVVGGLYTASSHGWIPTPGIMKALVPKQAVLDTAHDSQGNAAVKYVAPSTRQANVSANHIIGEVWEWNAQMGLMLANGGPSTTAGSLMEKHGVNLQLVRQDDTNKMQEDLIACAKELSGGAKNCSTGANFVIIMGDGAGQFAAGANPQLRKLGPEYQLRAIAAVGRSNGEDACMVPPAVVNNPKAMLGLTMEAVIRDGDWNICEKYLGDNDLKNNPDEKTYDPDAVNWINAPDYNTAASDYVSGTKCEDRKIVKDGHATGGTKRVCVDGIATWTPGDVTAVEKRGGLVKVVSTKQYSGQMPATIIGPAKFFRDNRQEVEGMLAALFEAGDQIKTNAAALQKAAAISAKVYNDQNADFWAKYYRGISETDAQGNSVPLGGSAVFNLADNRALYGLESGSKDDFRATYTTFANIDNQQYPELFKSTPIPDVKDVEDKSFITGAEAAMSNSDEGTGGAAEQTNYAAEAGGPVVSKRSYSVNFDTGKATLTPDGRQTLSQLADSLALTRLHISIDGYTDNTGSDAINRSLSEARAQAVKAFLQQSAPRTFPDSRFAVAGHGSDDPVADNNSAAGKAKNRRVEITLAGS
jgi:OOP family OmpA-OmpF porin